MDTYDVAVIGGGVIGTSIAFELAAEKLSVLVLDRQQPGREASWANAGILASSPHSPQDFPIVALIQQSPDLYSQFVTAIEQTSGKSVLLRAKGNSAASVCTVRRR